VSTSTGYVLLLGTDRDAVGEVGTVLQAHGLRVVAAPDAEAGVAHGPAAELVILDRIEGRSDAISLCSRLRMTPGMAQVPILCLAASDDVEERARFLEAGADDVMARPFDARELEARVDALLARGRRSREETAPVGTSEAPVAVPRLVGVLGPKGGSGTTTIAVNTALALAARGERRVALVDLDLQWGDVATQLNVSPRHSISDLARDATALAEPSIVESFAERHASGLSVFAAPMRPDESASVGAEHVGQLLPALRDTYRLTVVDAGSDLDERTLTVFEHVDRLIVPVLPEIPAMRAVRTLLEVLGELEGPSTGIVLVLNHAYPRDMLRRDEIEGALGANRPRAAVRPRPISGGGERR